jgi:hypothetical protein
VLCVAVARWIGGAVTPLTHGQVRL